MDLRKNSSFVAGRPKKSSAFSQGVNEGLRSYLMKVYQFMGLGLLLSALTAYLGTTEAFVNILFKATSDGYTYTFLGWIVIFSPLLLVFLFGSAVSRLNLIKAKSIFWLFSALMGFSFSSILMSFTAAALFQTFLISAASFGALCLYGYTTQKDLNGVGAFVSMALFGLIIATIMNFFMHSPAISYWVSVIGVAVFVGLTAFDSQRIKEIYNEMDTQQENELKAISGALTLYLDFINLFVMLLRILNNRD